MRGPEGSTGIGVGVAVPRDGWRKGEEKEEGGRPLRRPWEREDLPANQVKHCVIQAPVGGGWARGQRGGEEEEGWEARHEYRKCWWIHKEESRGEVEGVMEQRGVGGWQMPQSRPTAQEVIHIVKCLLQAPTVHSRVESELTVTQLWKILWQTSTQSMHQTSTTWKWHTPAWPVKVYTKNYWWGHAMISRQGIMCKP